MSNVQYKLSCINGTPHNPIFDEASIQKLIRTFETRDTDAYVCTYVKSGTTWTQQIINLLMNEGKEPPKAYTAAVPWLEAALAGGILGDREATGWTIDSINSAPDPRYFKTHASVNDLPRGKAKNLKVIYVARNPKDVLVSLYHHARNKPDFEFNGTFSDMLDFFMKGTCENGDWFTHVLDWWSESKKDSEHVLFLQYESLLANPKEGVQRIASFLGIHLTPQIIDAVVQKSSIGEMKKDSKAAAAVGFNHLRQGGAGNWRETFTVRQSEIFDALYEKRMAGKGLTFDFGDGLIM